jgi:hypothetical protein
VELNLRPPGIELWTTHTPTSHEVALLFLLFGGIFLHRLPELNHMTGWNLNLDRFTVHAGISALILLIPGIVAFGVHGVVRLVNQSLKPQQFIQLSYGYLPLVLGGTLAHDLRLGLTEAGRIIPVTLATFGMSGGMNGFSAPIVVADPAVIAFLQGTALVSSAFLSVVLTQKIARQPFFSLLPQHFAILGFTIALWYLIV